MFCPHPVCRPHSKPNSRIESFDVLSFGRLGSAVPGEILSLVQQPDEWARLGRLRGMWPRIGGKPRHTFALFRLYIFHILPHRLRIARHTPSKYGERIANYPRARLHRSGTVRGIRRKAGCIPSSWPGPPSGTHRGIENTSVNTASTLLYIAQLFGLK